VSQDDRLSEDQTQRQWWPWLLAGALLGIGIAGSLGAVIGIVVEGLLSLLVNRLPDGKVRTVFGAILLIGCGALAGAASALVFTQFRMLKIEMLLVDLLDKEEILSASTWVLIGSMVGGLIAMLDRLFMWVVFPYGTEPALEPMDDLDHEFEPQE
jgi:hypothetical protein